MASEKKERVTQLYIEMYELLHTIARHLLNDEELAKDAVQAAFEITWEKADKCLACPNPQGWIVKTLRNVVQNTKRHNNSEKRMLAEYAATHGIEAVFHEDGHRLEITYGPLAETDEFQLIREMAVEGLSQQEMANIRGISLAACKKRVQRAKDYLRKKMK